MSDDVDPGLVWRLIQRADELLKNPPTPRADAYAQARALLDEADGMLSRLGDGRSAAALGAQINARRNDLTRRQAAVDPAP